MTLDVLPDNHPGIDPSTVCLQITALREADPAVLSGSAFRLELRELLRKAGCQLIRQGKGSHEIWHSPLTGRTFPVPVGVVSRHTANSILRQRACRRRSE
jgi:predicted RNA binding protein YcfA (HicA-like mRNA interferase family)